jgi:hypothetical protein
MSFPRPGKFGPRKNKPGHSRPGRPFGRPQPPSPPQLQPTNDFVGVYERPGALPTPGGHHGRQGGRHPHGGPGRVGHPRHARAPGAGRAGAPFGRPGGQQRSGGPGGAARQGQQHTGPRQHRQGGPQKHPAGYPGQRVHGGYQPRTSGGTFPGQRPGSGSSGQHRQGRPGGWGGPPGAGRNQRHGKPKKKLVLAVKKKKRSGGKMDSWVSDRSSSWS